MSECRMDSQSRLKGKSGIKKGFLKDVTYEQSSGRQGVLHEKANGEWVWEVECAI